ncbi:MAG: tRNA 2-thiouridine(34) synthase MnmA [Bacteroidetes bacterium]|nr:tRNA 2-thiouridine(34) synthase MnmA [Bacteroidota bacterium]
MSKGLVVVGLSGGVDSSVAAALLLEDGYDVIGVFMKNWHDTEVTISDECPWEEDSKDALLVAEKLGIPFQTIDLSDLYKVRIVDYMFREYEHGRTPNPDVLCNREIKFDVFLKTALELGADYIATGHYCQKEETVIDCKPIYRLIGGVDKNKDQSYFLCQVNQEQLSKALFPIGHLRKSEVRQIAAKYDLITAGKRDSQGLCFIGKVRLPDFLQQQLKPKEGDIIEISSDHPIFNLNEKTTLSELAQPFLLSREMGKVIGKHSGAHYFTNGQRKGLGVGGKAEPLFILQTDVNENIIYVGMGENHPGLFRSALFMNTSEIHWLRQDFAPGEGNSLPVFARIRYRQELQKATLIQESDGAFLLFDTPQKSVTPGQFAAWYIDDEMIGSGVISA